MHVTQRTTRPVAIAYDIAGSGPLVVFLHGIGGNRSNWQGQVAYFAARFCAVAWDARGYGASDDPPQTLKFSDYADDLMRLLDHLRAERAHMVGLSMGGMILQDFYGRYADRVATMALVDTSVGFGSVSAEVRRDFLARRLDPLERGLTLADIAPGVVEVLVAKSATAAARQRMRASIEALHVAAYKQALHAIITTDFRAVLPHINVPTLVIVGEEDVVTPPADSEFLTRNISGAKLVSIPGAGHLTNIETPEAFNAALEAFLNLYTSHASVVSAG
ncbi:MAG: alpha/beta fold hydrolase [Candidatus Entotheonellia bacterium]